MGCLGKMGGLGSVSTCLDQRQTTRWCPSLVIYSRRYCQGVRILRPGLHPRSPHTGEGPPLRHSRYSHGYLDNMCLQHPVLSIVWAWRSHRPTPRG